MFIIWLNCKQYPKVSEYLDFINKYVSKIATCNLYDAYAP